VKYISSSLSLSHYSLSIKGLSNIRDNGDKKATEPCYVLGVGMTKFVKPRGNIDYTELGFEAGVKAMLDAHINYDDVDQGVACYCYGDSTCGQRVFYQFGMTQIPIYNVNNNCSTGSTGLYMARNMISHGAADCALVIGFEKMFPGSLQTFFQDRSNPTMPSNLVMKETRGITNAPGAAQIFGNAGREYMEKYDLPNHPSFGFRTNNAPDTAPKPKTSLKSGG
jgi:sterol carrier protein 2